MRDLADDLLNSVKRPKGNGVKQRLEAVKIGNDRIVLNDTLGKIGLFSPEERAKFELSNRLVPLSVAGTFLAIRVFFSGTLLSVGFVCLFGLLIGFVYQKGAVKRRAANYKEI